MKKSKLLALGLIALVLAGGLALASCNEHPNCPGGGSSGGKGGCEIRYSTTTTGKVTSYKISTNKDCNDQCIDIQKKTKVDSSGHDEYSCTCL